VKLVVSGAGVGNLGAIINNAANVVTSGAKQQFYLLLNTNAVPASGIP
jgi:hypothetical protein